METQGGACGILVPARFGRMLQLVLLAFAVLQILPFSPAVAVVRKVHLGEGSQGEPSYRNRP